MSASVSTPVFEGPIDLLLQLVNNHELELYDIPLAAVVDAFVAEVAGWESVDLQTLSEFLMVASVLIELKSRRLLPGPDDIDTDEELVGWEERDLLLARLLECQAYAAAADGFAVLFEQAARSVPRTAGLEQDFAAHAPDLLEGVTPDELAAAFLRATADRPVPVVDLYHVTVDTVTVADAVSDLSRRLPAVGHDHVPVADPSPHLAHGDHRELPGPPRALQAGAGLPRPGPHLRGPAGGLAGRRPPARAGGPGPLRRVRGLTVPLSPEARAIEAVLVVAVEPVPAGLLAELLEVPVEQIDPLCDELAESCRTEGRGFDVVRIAGGFRIQTHPDLAPYVERFANVGVSSRLSAAALETLAIVAYKQPVSRAQIAALRGVNVDGVVRLLEHRGYIAAVGRAPGPGQAVLYATTDAFLERLGLDRLDQLPPVEDLLPGPEALAELEDQMRPVGDA